MATDPGDAQVWTILSAIGVWFLSLCAGIFGYGKLSARVDSHDRKLSSIDRAFIDANGNPRLMTVLGHQEICHANNAAVSSRVETLCQKIEMWHKEDREGRAELNRRVKAIEESVVAIDTELRVRREALIIKGE